MLRSIVLIAIVAAASATTASTTLSCYTATVAAPASTSLCAGKGGSQSFCTLSQTLADASAAAVKVGYDATTTASQTAVGTLFCAFFNGTINTSYWTDPSNACESSTCDASTCGATPAPGATVQPWCCSYVNSLIGQMCTGAAVTVTPTTTTSFGTCADTNCKSSASTVAYSVFAALIAAILALVNF